MPGPPPASSHRRKPTLIDCSKSCTHRSSESGQSPSVPMGSIGARNGFDRSARRETLGGPWAFRISQVIDENRFACILASIRTGQKMASFGARTMASFGAGVGSLVTRGDPPRRAGASRRSGHRPGWGRCILPHLEKIVRWGPGLSRSFAAGRPVHSTRTGRPVTMSGDHHPSQEPADDRRPRRPLRLQPMGRRPGHRSLPGRPRRPLRRRGHPGLGLAPVDARPPRRGQRPLVSPVRGRARAELPWARPSCPPSTMPPGSWPRPRTGSNTWSPG